MISIHALLAESDGKRGKVTNGYDRFLSTLSLRRATVHFDNYNLHCVISIHALLAESDCFFCAKLLLQLIFLSTLSLRRATDGLIASANFCRFLSTLSLRRATTQCRLKLSKCTPYFYPRSPCGERRTQSQIDARVIPISIHALLAESDHW